MVRQQIARIFRLDDLREKQGSSKIIHIEQIGSTGTESYSGYPTEEYLYTLRGTERADLFDKMRRSDAQVKMLLSAVMGPILKSKWRVDPGNHEDPESVKDAELISHILFHDMDKPWLEFLREALALLTYGHSVFEVIDKVVIDQPEYGSYNSIASFAFRSPRTIERWNLDPKTGNLASISQYAYGDLDRLVDIPADFLLVFSLDKEGSNYEGISALRSIYGNWFRKNTYMKLNAIGIEKFAIPTPIVHVPTGKDNQTQRSKLKEALEAYTTHQKNYLIIPEGWTVDLKTNTYDPQKVEIAIDNEDKRMAKAFLANFLELGMNGFGSQSLATDLSDFFMHSMDYVASIISSGINQTVIPRLVQLNRGPRSSYPKLCHSGISDTATKELAEVINAFANSGLIKGDDKLEEHIREAYGLPKPDKDTARDKPAPAGFGAQPAGKQMDLETDPDDMEDPSEDDDDEASNQKSLIERIVSMRLSRGEKA